MPGTAFSMHLSQFKILLTSLNKNKTTKCLLQILKNTFNNYYINPLDLRLHLGGATKLYLFLRNYRLLFQIITIKIISQKEQLFQPLKTISIMLHILHNIVKPVLQNSFQNDYISKFY